MITIYECEWNISDQRLNYIKIKKQEDPTFFQEHYLHYKISKSTMEKSILTNKVFGFCKINISTPDHLKDKYADFCPVIKHTEIGIDDIGDLMKKYALKHNLMKQKRSNLISLYRGKGIIMMMPMIKFVSLFYY